MKLSEKKSGTFTPHPEYTGRGVCVDVTPPETKQTEYGPKEKFRLVFETEAKNEKGETCVVWSSGFTASLNEKAAFRKFLRQWFGRDLTEQELQEFDTEALLGRPAFLVITHSTGENSETYANITACTPHKQGEALKPTGKFTRKKDRQDKPQGGSSASYRKAETPANTDGEPVGRDNWMTVKVCVGQHAGVDLGDLDEDAVRKLNEKWIPVFKAAAKPPIAERRLAEAIAHAIAELDASKNATPAAPAAQEPAY